MSKFFSWLKSFFVKAEPVIACVVESSYKTSVNGAVDQAD